MSSNICVMPPEYIFYQPCSLDTYMCTSEQGCDPTEL